MGLHEKSKGKPLNNENLEKANGGIGTDNRFQCPFCNHPPFSTQSEVINHVWVRHPSKIKTD